jgi:ABC-2 type transport system permease protein
MHNVLLVIKHEIKTTLGKRSFWITTFVFPIVIFAITFGSQIMAQRMAEDAVTETPTPTSQPTDTEEGEPAEIQAAMGYVDEAGIITDFPGDFPEGLLAAYPDREAAQTALRAGDLTSYYVVPGDFTQSHEIILVQRQFSPMQQLDQEEDVFQNVVLYNLTGSAEMAQLIDDPTPSIITKGLAPGDAEPAEEGGEGGEGAGAVPYLVIFIFFISLTMSSGFMLRSVSNEKENRVAEVLLLSLRPRELMLGKVIGLGIVALVQLLFWMGAGVLVLRSGSPLFRLLGAASSLSLPPSFFAWGLIYFLLGFLMFSSALGAIGALAPSAREGNQFTFAVLLPLMIPLWFNVAFTEAPNGLLPVILSLFPLTAPVSMMARLAATAVPLWQLLVSVALLGATTYGFVLVAARFFRADTLLSSASLDWKRLRQEVKRAVS